MCVQDIGNKIMVHVFTIYSPFIHHLFTINSPFIHHLFTILESVLPSLDSRPEDFRVGSAKFGTCAAEEKDEAGDQDQFQEDGTWGDPSTDCSMMLGKNGGKPLVKPPDFRDGQPW